MISNLGSISIDKEVMVQSDVFSQYHFGHKFGKLRKGKKYYANTKFVYF